jgi:hypothetical protein
MKKLKIEFNKHGARHILEKRTVKVAMFYVYGSQTSPDYVTSIEVFLVTIKKTAFNHGEKYPEDSRMGIGFRSKCFCGKLKYWQAKPYYELLVNHWNNPSLQELVDIYEKTYLGLGVTELSKLSKHSVGHQMKIA